jgi:CheY-like chemotaxis protein
MSSRPVRLLLIEDNPGDVVLLREALRDAEVPHELHVAVDGREALAFLHRRGAYADSPRPDLILLDLNLPGKDGRELLAEIKRAPDLRRIPVIVLTSSEAEADISKSYELQASCYLTKPVAYSELLDVLRRMESFWLTLVRYPSHPESPVNA